MRKTWQIKDLIDLEYFLHSDENADEDGDKDGDKDSSQSIRVQRDRDIYLKHIEPLVKQEKSLSRSSIIRLWMKQRRIREKEVLGPDTVFPGEAFHEIHRLLLYGFGILGLLTGSGLALSLLSYSGTAPLNVSIYLGFLVLMQAFLLLLLLGYSLARLVKRSFLHHSVLYSLVSRLLIKLTLKYQSGLLKSLSGAKRSSLQAVVGLARSKQRVYGSLFYWPVFILAQIFGIGFNLGALCATLLRVLGSDMAFGWQSTVQFGPRVVYLLVKLAALPWSWFVPPEMAHPSLAQIEGSRIVLKDGIYHLATQDLTAWWPFLCLAVLFYGLIPRLLLLVVGVTAQKKALGGQSFSHSACDRLMHRLETPLVSTLGRPSLAEGEKYPDSRPLDPHGIGSGLEASVTVDKSLIVLLPVDICKECPDDELNRQLVHRLGSKVHEKIIIGEDHETDKAVPVKLAAKDWNDTLSGVLILQEAWQPPIQEDLTFIQLLRKALGERRRITVGLIGKPSPETIFTPVKVGDWEIWNKKINSLGDPLLGVVRLV